MSVSCIDISHWQDFPDFEEVAAAGVVAMIHKASEGTSYIDPNRITNIIAATDAGIACCTYHWLKPGNAAEQMEFYLEVVDPVDGERMVIDYEESGCTLDDLHEAVETLRDDPRDLQITVYSGHLLKEQLGSKRDELLAEHTDLWLAQYTSGEVSWPSGTYEHWTLWQYSETGEIDGIDDNYVDLNEFDGTDAELVQWISPAGRPPPSPRPPKPPIATVKVAITAPEKVMVEVSVNDQAVNARRHSARRARPRGSDI